MKTLLFILSLILFSCGRTTNCNDLPINKDTLNTTVSNNISNKADDKSKVNNQELIAFWNSAIEPFIKKDKKTVISNIDFPLKGDWSFILDIEQDKDIITKEEFIKNYDYLINKDFLKSLSKQTYNDITEYKSNDTLFYDVSLVRKLGKTEGGLVLTFYKKGNSYLLNKYSEVGANFYYKGEE